MIYKRLVSYKQHLANILELDDEEMEHEAGGPGSGRKPDPNKQPEELKQPREKKPEEVKEPKSPKLSKEELKQKFEKMSLDKIDFPKTKSDPHGVDPYGEYKTKPMQMGKKNFTNTVTVIKNRLKKIQDLKKKKSLSESEKKELDNLNQELETKYKSVVKNFGLKKLDEVLKYTPYSDVAIRWNIYNKFDPNFKWDKLK